MSCCAYYDDGPEFITKKFVTARKQHKCCECGAEIKPGDAYERVTGKWSGDFDSIATCEPCADLRESLSAVWCTAYHNLRDDYAEYCVEIGAHKYDEEKDEYFYPENHLRLNA